MWPAGRKRATATHQGDLYGTLERNVQTFQINVHFKLSTVSLLK